MELLTRRAFMVVSAMAYTATKVRRAKTVAANLAGRGALTSRATVAVVDGNLWTRAYTDNGNGTWTSTTPVDNGNGTWSAA